MNKTEMIGRIAMSSDINIRKAGAALDAVLDNIEGALKAGGKVTLPGFGTFAAVHRPARKGHNPATGEPIDIAASTAVKFSPSRPMKDRLNEPQRQVGPQRNSPMPQQKRA